MPPHSSHKLQPLDVGCFGPLKEAYGRQIETLMQAHITHVAKPDFFSAFSAAFNLAMTEENIRGWFRGVGIVPLSPETVVSRLDDTPRARTPPEPSAEIPSS